MERTLPAALIRGLLHDEETLTRFQRGLRRNDQRVLDDLFAEAQPHLAAAAETAQSLSLEVFLLALLIEEHKQIIHLRSLLEDRRHD